jgi:hypothetical protein
MQTVMARRHGMEYLFPVIRLACLVVYYEAPCSQESDKFYISTEEDSSVYLHVNAVYILLCFIFLLGQSVSPYRTASVLDSKHL